MAKHRPRDVVQGGALLAVLLLGCATPGVEDALPTVSVQVPLVAPFPGGAVAWHSWGDRDSARMQHRPILLLLYSVRSFWCRDLMDHCFGDGELAEMLGRIAFPVWVDADRRPDVFERFSLGGLPTVAFLTPDERWITGSTFLDPEDLADFLRRVFVLFDNPERMQTLEEQRAEFYRRRNLAARANPRPELPLASPLWARVSDSLSASWDRGDPVSPESIPLLPEHHRPELSRRLRARRDADGSFFLSSLTPDGSVVDAEKHLAVNAALLLALSESGKGFRKEALGLADALLQHFMAPGDSLLGAGFAGFEQGGQFPRDPSVYSGWNGLAASGFAALYASSGDRRYLEAGNRILAGLASRFQRADGFFVREEGAGDPVFLEDQALIARAALDLYEAGGKAGHLELARGLAKGFVQGFGDASGGFRDRAPETGSAVFSAIDRWAPSGNGVAVQVLVRLFAHTGEEAHRESAARVLRALVGPNIDHAAHLGAMNRGLYLFLQTG